MRSVPIALREREGVQRRAQCSPERSARVAGVARERTAGASQTLDELMTAAWAGLRADAPIACPLCDSVMEPLWSAGAGVVGGRCRNCGSEMS